MIGLFPSHDPPGAIYDMDIGSNVVGVKVRLPMNIDISEEEAIQLENEMHDALEAILSKYFRGN